MTTDPKDTTSARADHPDAFEGLVKGVAGLCVGVPTNFFFDHLAAPVAARVHDAIQVLDRLGIRVVPVTVPKAHIVEIVGDTIGFPETSLYHRRWLRERPDDYSPTVRAGLQLGELCLATDYLQAQRLRAVVAQELMETLSDVDAIVTPTTPVVAIRQGQTSIAFDDGHEETALFAYCRLTYIANVTGFPAVSVPCGLDPDGLPVGLQLIGRPFDEGLLLRIAHAYQQETEWHGITPPVVRKADGARQPL